MAGSAMETIHPGDKPVKLKRKELRKAFAKKRKEEKAAVRTEVRNKRRALGEAVDKGEDAQRARARIAEEKRNAVVQVLWVNRIGRGGSSTFLVFSTQLHSGGGMARPSVSRCASCGRKLCAFVGVWVPGTRPPLSCGQNGAYGLSLAPEHLSHVLRCVCLRTAMAHFPSEGGVDPSARPPPLGSQRNQCGIDLMKSQ